MALTNSTNVKKVIEVDETINLTPFIETASELVTEVCAGAGYTDTRLELIERWLAAHFYAVRDPRAESESVGPLRTKFQGQTGMHFESTTYGQQALLLDTNGGLANLQAQTKKGNKVKVGVSFIGTPASSSLQAPEYGVSA